MLNVVICDPFPQKCTHLARPEITIMRKVVTWRFLSLYLRNLVFLNRNKPKRLRPCVAKLKRFVSSQENPKKLHFCLWDNNITKCVSAVPTSSPEHLWKFLPEVLLRDNSQSLHSLDSYTIRRRRSPSGRRAAVLAARYRPFACLPFNAATSSVAATSKCRPLVVLQTYPSPCDSLLLLHFCALREVIQALRDIRPSPNQLLARGRGPT